MKLIDLTGNKFGRLTVICRGKNKKKKTYWLCKCECGNVKEIQGGNLKLGDTKSCGCIENIGNTKHKLSNHFLYGTWKAMKTRCHSEKHVSFKDYGSKGIKVCDEWMDSPESFINWAMSSGYEYGLTLERKDNDKGYNPENCKWATRMEQARNTSRNRWINIDDKVMCAKDASVLLNIPYKNILYHLNKCHYQEVMK